VPEYKRDIYRMLGEAGGGEGEREGRRGIFCCRSFVSAGYLERQGKHILCKPSFHHSSTPPPNLPSLPPSLPPSPPRLRGHVWLYTRQRHRHALRRAHRPFPLLLRQRPETSPQRCVSYSFLPSLPPSFLPSFAISSFFPSSTSPSTAGLRAIHSV